MEILNAIGRRKSSVARVYLSKGTGTITVNNKDYKDFFPVAHLQVKIQQPMQLTETDKSYDINVNVNGGGIKGQAEAITLGIARALVKIDEDLKPTLKSHNLMTRDRRVVERKKPGLKKARKASQFSKR